MKYDGIVLFSDLDGTLLNDQRKLSRENFESLSYFVSQGGRFAVATGRMERTTLVNFPELPTNLPSIFFNGALIFDISSRKSIHSVFTPEDLAPMFQNILDRYPSASVEVNTSGKAYVFQMNDIIRIQVAREGLTFVEVPWSEIPMGWYKVLVADEHETLIEVKKEIDVLNRTDINVMFSESELLDIVSKDVSKGAALSYLKKNYRRDWRLVVAVGDNDNDLEMIKEADVGIAVANARDCVKEAAKHEVAHHNTPCIPQVLKIIDSYL
jgi:Cof subfamily protein (haloacid dehalogenase superfamily)